jgi:hypothetical protein
LIWRLSVRHEKPPSLSQGDAGFQPGAVLGPGQNATAVSQPYEQLVRHSSQNVAPGPPALRRHFLPAALTGRYGLLQHYSFRIPADPRLYPLPAYVQEKLMRVDEKVRRSIVFIEFENERGLGLITPRVSVRQSGALEACRKDRISNASPNPAYRPPNHFPNRCYGKKTPPELGGDKVAVSVRQMADVTVPRPSPAPSGATGARR